jgi:CubicO group peptidase (beta-lactamase class C family)
MNSSGIALSNSMKSRLAVGHNAMLMPVGNWDVPGIPGAGALRSTTNDLLNFLAAELSPQSSGLKSAMELQLSVTRPTPVPRFSAGLGWFVTPGSGGPFRGRMGPQVDIAHTLDLVRPPEKALSYWQTLPRLKSFWI